MIFSPPPPVSSLVSEGISARAAKALTTTCQRAETLQSDGYKFARTDRPGVWECQKPAKVDKTTGEILTEYAPYIVEIRQDEGSCTCEGFGHHGHCKHERACRVAVREALELLLGGQS